MERSVVGELELELLVVVVVVVVVVMEMVDGEGEGCSVRASRVKEERPFAAWRDEEPGDAVVGRVAEAKEAVTGWVQGSGQQRRCTGAGQRRQQEASSEQRAAEIGRASCRERVSQLV